MGEAALVTIEGFGVATFENPLMAKLAESTF
jgi:hypothetical protein